ncbi:MAG: hypothetical protein AAB571_06795 [Chloroflexota bacterium]
MVNKFGQRPIYRFKSSVMTHITLEEWPTDVPLPNTFTLHETEDGVIHPFWHIYLEPNETVEMVAGHFQSPLGLEEVMQCCDEAMQKARWNSKETVVAQERRFTLRYTNSTPDKYVDINFRRPNGATTTKIQIRRVVKHPYIPPVAEEESVEENVEPALEEVTK